MISNADLWEPGAVGLFDDGSGSGALPSGLGVVAFDPGGTTGWVSCLLVVAELETLGVVGAVQKCIERRWVDFGEVETFEFSSSLKVAVGTWSLYHMEAKVVDGLVEICLTTDYDCREWSNGKASLTHVVVEDFTLRERTKDRSLLSPVRLASGLFNGLHAEPMLDVDWHFQSPVDKSTVSADQLKEAGLYFPGKPHACDAARHMILFLRKMLQAD